MYMYVERPGTLCNTRLKMGMNQVLVRPVVLCEFRNMISRAVPLQKSAFIKSCSPRTRVTCLLPTRNIMGLSYVKRVYIAMVASPSRPGPSAFVKCMKTTI